MQVQVLIEALPYIKKFYAAKLVIKLGGRAMEDAANREAILKDIVLLKYVGMNPVVVHGGAQEITQLMHKLGKEAEFVEGLRATDEETMELVQMVLAGKLNKDLVAIINRLGGAAVGISGKDANLIIAKRYNRADLGLVGEIERINPELIDTLLKEAYIPVIAPIGNSIEGETLNINADTVAAELSCAIKARKLIILTDVTGIFAEPDKPETLISTLDLKAAKEFLNSGRLSAGMLPKLSACIRAIEADVEAAHIIDGRMPHSLLIELLTDKGIGTMVVKNL